MEEKQTRISQYEEMQISAVLLPFSGERTEADDLDTGKNCIYRNISQF